MGMQSGMWLLIFVLFTISSNYLAESLLVGVKTFLLSFSSLGLCALYHAFLTVGLGI